MQVNLPNGNVLGSASAQSGVRPGAKRGAGGPKAKAKSKANPLVYAATMRAKTAKVYLDVEKNLGKAMTLSEELLNVTAPKLLQDSASDDCTLALVRSRRELVTAAMNSSGKPGPDSTAANLALFNLCLQDPYLKDCRGTILDEMSCQTLGAIKYCRNVALDLYLG